VYATNAADDTITEMITLLHAVFLLHYFITLSQTNSQTHFTFLL